MTTSIDRTTRLAYETEGAGTPVVLLHGLTFDRRTWRPVVDALDGSVHSIAIDLPAHGESGGAPASLYDVAEQVHEVVASLGVDRPVVVGHSMSAGLAFIYALAHPARGVVVVDSGTHVQPFAELVHRVAPALRGAGFAHAWQPFEQSLGIERVPEPVRSLVYEAHAVRPEVVAGYWEMLLSADPAEFQASIDAQVAELDVPCLAVFGRLLTGGERERFDRMPDLELEEWVGDGHFVHLVDPARFAARLRRFVERCSGPA
jgi:pimeloyl-ACP methyl ester carboxylesterase